MAKNTIKPSSFSTDQDPEAWIRLYDFTAEMNGWNDKQKLLYICNCMPQPEVNWALRIVSQDNATWDHFKALFLEKFAVRISSVHILQSLLTFRLQPKESTLSYIERMKALKLLYDQELTRRASDAIVFRNASLFPNQYSTSTPTHPTSPDPRGDNAAQDSPNAIETTTELPPQSDIVLPEHTFIKYFILGVHNNPYVQQTMRARNPQTLQDAYIILRSLLEYDDELTDYAQFADTILKNSKPNVNINASQAQAPSSSIGISTVESSTQDSTMEKLFKQIELLTQAVDKMNRNPKTGSPKSTLQCFNCQELGHILTECPAPCKLCGGTDHNYKACKTPDKKKIDITPSKGSEHMLVEEVEPEDFLLGEKRERDRDGSSLAADEAKRTKASSGKKVAQSPPTVTKEPKTSQKDNITKENDVPKETTAVSNQGSVEAELCLEQLLHDQVFRLSAAQLAALSPLFRSRFKKGLTKTKASEAKLVDEPTQRPRGKSAPRVQGLVNNVPCEIILDGGCVPAIISSHFVADLGLNEQILPVQRPLSLGNGATMVAKGVLKDLSINVGNVIIVITDVLVLDVGQQYSLLLGRDAFHDMKITTDWETHQWFVKNKQRKIELPVYYARREKEAKGLDTPVIISSLQKTKLLNPRVEEDSSSESEEEEFMLIMTDAPEKALLIQEDRMDGQILPILNDLKDNPWLSSDEKEQVIKLIQAYPDVFGTSYEHLKQTDLVSLHIDTQDAKPIYQKPYARFSPDELKLLTEEIQEMVMNDIMVPHKYVSGDKGSGWSFPCRFVSKKDGSKRLVVQFMKLNDVTVRDTWPIPSLQDSIESLGGSKWLSCGDMLKGFNAIPVDEDSISKLTVSTPIGAFSFKCMPFGIVNGPAVYARCMYLACNPLNTTPTSDSESPRQRIINFYDDCTLFSPDFKTHLQDLEDMLARFRDVKLVLNSKKCKFFQQEVDLLGFHVSVSEGITPQLAKLSKIMEYPVPSNQTQVRAFLNLCGFYRQHVRCFSEIANPLSLLLKKGTDFVWSEACQKAFDNLKSALNGYYTLQFPDFQKEFQLFTDASDIGIGAVLTQRSGDPEEYRPISCLSRKLHHAELNYPTVEKELLSVVYACAKFRKYLIDKPFMLFTDNNAVKGMLTKRDSPHQRLQRWIFALGDYRFISSHIAGKQNVVADVFSRFPPESTEELEGGLEVLEQLYEQFLLLEESNYEPELVIIQQYLENLDLGVSHFQDDKVVMKASNYKVARRYLYRKVFPDRWVKVPYLNERQEIIEDAHEGGGHFGKDATWKKLYERFWWPGCYNQVQEHVKGCKICTIYSNVEPKLPYLSVPVQHLFEQYAIDFIGPFPASKAGKKYILVAVEMYSRWPIAKAVEAADADTVANFLYKDIFCVFGPFSHLLSDNGTHFDAQVIDTFLAMMKVHHKFTSGYRPQCNGMVEKLNGTIIRAIQKLTTNDPLNWDIHLPSVLWAYRTKVHNTLHISPYQMLFGQDPSPQDPILILGQELGFQRYAKLVDRNRLDELIIKDHDGKADRAKGIPTYMYKPGDLVVRLRHKKATKLDSKFKPEEFRVVAAYNNHTYKLADLQGRPLKRNINHANLKLMQAHGQGGRVMSGRPERP